jgi:hypothetical protein
VPGVCLCVLRMSERVCADRSEPQGECHEPWNFTVSRGNQGVVAGVAGNGRWNPWECAWPGHSRESAKSLSPTMHLL